MYVRAARFTGTILFIVSALPGFVFVYVNPNLNAYMFKLMSRHEGRNVVVLKEVLGIQTKGMLSQFSSAAQYYLVDRGYIRHTHTHLPILKGIVYKWKGRATRRALERRAKVYSNTKVLQVNEKRAKGWVSKQAYF